MRRRNEPLALIGAFMSSDTWSVTATVQVEPRQNPLVMLRDGGLWIAEPLRGGHNELRSVESDFESQLQLVERNGSRT